MSEMKQSVTLHLDAPGLLDWLRDLPPGVTSQDVEQAFAVICGGRDAAPPVERVLLRLPIVRLRAIELAAERVAARRDAEAAQAAARDRELKSDRQPRTDGQLEALIGGALKRGNISRQELARDILALRALCRGMADLIRSACPDASAWTDEDGLGAEMDRLVP